jgi:hypothetical protein
MNARQESTLGGEIRDSIQSLAATVEKNSKLITDITHRFDTYAQITTAAIERLEKYDSMQNGFIKDMRDDNRFYSRIIVGSIGVMIVAMVITSLIKVG